MADDEDPVIADAISKLDAEDAALCGTLTQEWLQHFLWYGLTPAGRAMALECLHHRATGLRASPRA